MKRTNAATLVASVALIGMVGCTEESKSSTKQETTISTPRGTTTITTEKEVKTTDDKPAADKP